MSSNIRKTVVPAIPQPGVSPKEIVAGLHALKEATEVGLGRRGDPLDRYVTVRELRDAGLASPADNGRGGISAGPATNGGGQVPVDVPGTVNGLPDNTPPDYGQDDLTPPPMPTHVMVQNIAPDNLMVYYDPPAYGNHAYAEIFLISPTDAGEGATQYTYTKFLQDAGPGFDAGKPCTGAATGTNQNRFFRGRADGSSAIFELGAEELGNGGSTLGAALNPPAWYAFVRFVSLAGISGPFGPPDNAASGHPSIDPLRVLDLMTADVESSGLYTNLRQFIGVDAVGLQKLKAGGGITALFNGTVEQGGTISQLWSVRMDRQLNDGTFVSAGFGLGITENTTTGIATSLFAVEADKFAVWSTGGNNYLINSVTIQPGDPTIATFALGQGASFKVGDHVVTRWKSDVEGGLGNFDNLEGTVLSLVGIAGAAAQITVQRNTPNTESVARTWPVKDAGTYYVMKATSIPFIVDTVENAVGIRGKLIVDGLVRATQGDFDTLTANNAFINTLRAGVVNANVVCGQKLIAGAGIDPAIVSAGSINSTKLANLDAWIVELSTPGPGQFPFRIYNPKRFQAGSPGASLLQLYGGNPKLNELPYLELNGDLRVGGDGVFNLRQGGAVAFGNKSRDDVHYTFWCGADTDYNQSAAQMENNGFFWIRASTLAEQAETGSTARAGFNLDLFLGNNALAIPSLASQNQDGSTIYQDGNNGPRAAAVVTSSTTQDAIVIRSLRDGSVAKTLVQVNGYLASHPDGRDSNFKRFVFAASLVDTRSGATIPVQSIEMDDYGPEAWDYNLMGIVDAPAGTYRVKIDLTNVERDQREMSIVQGWNAFAMQMATGGALS